MGCQTQLSVTPRIGALATVPIFFWAVFMNKAGLGTRHDEGRIMLCVENIN
jgi:hypothetical protein